VIAVPDTRAQLSALDVDREPALVGRYSSMVEPFLAAVAADPHRVALVCGDREVTYAQAGAAVNRLARVLLDQGVRPGDPVAYLLCNGPEIVELFYAIQRIGAVAVPLNVRSAPREVAYLVHASDATCLVLAAALADRVQPVVDELAGCCLLCVDGPFTSDAVGSGAPPWARSLTDMQAPAPECDRPLVRNPEAISRIQFTGGSTGTPKGVARTHRADLVNCEGTYLSNGLWADERKVVLIQCPLEHHGGHAWFTMAIAQGATLVLCSSFDPVAILRQIEHRAVSYLILLPPTTCARLLREPTIGDYDLSSVRLVQSSAGGTSGTLVVDVAARFPNAVFNYGWGQTESGLGTSLVLTPAMVTDGDPRATSVGRPMPFTQVRIVDDDGYEVAHGTVGEAQVRSAAVMAGYYRQETATAEVLDADGWLRTGDMMVRDADGFFWLKSRRRELIKSGGENVFVGEVELAVRAHPAVADAMVYPVPDDQLGEAVAVAVELVPGVTLSLPELQRFCRGSLASFKKPRELVLVDSLDRDFSGKLDRRHVLRTCDVRRAVQASRAARESVDDLITQVADVPAIYRIEVPNPGGPEASTACYLVRGGDRDLLVDTGAESSTGLGVLVRALERLGADRARTDLLLTHEHPDHVGLTWRMRHRDARVAMSAAGLDVLRGVGSAETARHAVERWRSEGFDGAQVHELEAARRRSLPIEVLGEDVVPVRDGTVLRVGDHELRVVATPGHTPGSVCLLVPEAGLLLVGDHLLWHTVPPVMWLPGTADAVGDHLRSLVRVAELGDLHALPGHGPAGDVRERAVQIAARHERRAAALLDLVDELDSPTGAQLAAASIARTVPSPARGERPPTPGLHWLRASRTVAFLDLLVVRGALVRTADRDGLTRYHLAKG
jgi:acyl-CoA synthetase (AMP-forming)/AMP-acid ligase II/glyoxylase-like metal-dependent hydrolase (beta-lactamase superfamily II)